MLTQLFQANKSSESISGRKLLPFHHTPTCYNEGEMFGVAYLYRQAGREFELSEENLESKEKGDENIIDEGFIDEVDTIIFSEDLGTVGLEEE